MSDWRSREPEGLEERLERRERLERGERLSRAPKPETTLAELVNDSVRKIVTAIVAAGALIGAGAYLAGGVDVEAPRYQVTTTPDGRIIRIDTDSGRVIACEGERCGIVVERGQDLDDSPPPRVGAPGSEAPPALPAPGATPTSTPSPTPDNGAAPAQR